MVLDRLSAGAIVTSGLRIGDVNNALPVRCGKVYANISNRYASLFATAKHTLAFIGQHECVPDVWVWIARVWNILRVWGHLFLTDFKHAGAGEQAV